MLIPHHGVRPACHPSVFLAEGAMVIGDVEIDEDSSVWFHAVVRGDIHWIRIGRRTNIQDGAVLHVVGDSLPCLLGDCVTVCPFDALHIGDKGIVEVDQGRCTGCGLCVPVCPKELFQLYPRDRRIELSCVARDKGTIVKSTCMVGCILCRKCVAKCPAEAISFDGATIVIDHERCKAYGPSCNEVCVDICPSTILHRIGQAPQPRDRPEAVVQ